MAAGVQVVVVLVLVLVLAPMELGRGARKSARGGGGAELQQAVVRQHLSEQQLGARLLSRASYARPIPTVQAYTTLPV